jgi:hypothetical protein
MFIGSGVVAESIVRKSFFATTARGGSGDDRFIGLFCKKLRQKISPLGVMRWKLPVLLQFPQPKPSNPTL